MLRPVASIALASTLALVACAPPAPTLFGSEGYRSGLDSYGFRYDPAHPGQLLGPEWVLSNFEDRSGRLRQKTKGTYRHQTAWVLSDGDTMRADFVAHDLYLRHGLSNGIIWVRRLPLPRSMRGKASLVLAENYANSVSGSIYTAQLGANVDERRLATKVVRSEPISLGGRDAHMVDFEIVNVDQLQADPNAPRSLARIVLVLGDFKKQLKLGRNKGTLNSGRRVEEVPAVLMIGYANDLSRFESLVPDMDALVSRLWIR